MKNPLYNKVVFDPFDLMGISADDEGNREILEDYHIDTLKCWIRKYCTDHNYIKKNEFLPLLHNVIDLFKKMNLHSVFDKEPMMLKHYVVEAINRQITFVLMFDAFSHFYAIHVTFIIGIKDEVQIKVTRSIYDECNAAIYTNLTRSLSPRGIYHMFDSGIVNKYPFHFPAIYTFLYDFIKEAEEKIKSDDECQFDNEILSKLKTYYAYCKFYNLKDQYKSKFLDDEGKVKVDDIVEDIPLNPEYYDEDDLRVLCDRIDPVIDDTLKFTTIEPFMVPIKNLYNIISEIIINSILIDSIDIVSNMNGMGGKDIVSEEIYKKGFDLLNKFISINISYIEKMCDLKFNDDQIEDILKLADISKKIAIDDDIDFEDEGMKNFSFYDEYMNEKTKSEISCANDTGPDENYNDEMIDNVIFNNENDLNDTNDRLKEIWHNIYYSMNQKYNTKDFYKKFKLNNLEYISNRISADLMTYSNLDVIYSLYENEASPLFTKYIDLFHNKNAQSINQLYLDIYKDHGFTFNMKSINKLYKDYIVPIKNKLSSVSENINALNDSFNSLFPDSFRMNHDDDE